MKLKELKKGEWFTRKAVEYPNEKQVFIRGEYIREERRYECQRWSDINSFIYLKGDTEVFTDFIF